MNRYSEWKKRVKKQLIEKNGINCSLCGLPMLSPFYFYSEKSKELDKYEKNILATIDHIVERRNGGNNYFSNLRLTHMYCNSTREKYANPRDNYQWEIFVEQELQLRNIL